MRQRQALHLRIPDPVKKNGDPKVAVLDGARIYAALNNLCGSITNFFGTPASNSP